MKEIWKDIEGYEGRYQISNLGRVKSLKRNIIRKHSVDRGGYHFIIIDKTHLFLIHRLVAKAFIPNPNNYGYVNHIDEDKSNNCVDNLEWCSFQYNCNYGKRNMKVAMSKWKPVYQFDKNGNFIREWACITDASTGCNIWRQDIGKCCRGKLKTAGGYIWRYKEKGGA